MSFSTLAARFAEYDRLTEDQRAAVDEMRCLPVPELRRLVAKARLGIYADESQQENGRRRHGSRRLNRFTARNVVSDEEYARIRRGLAPTTFSIPLPGTVRTPCGEVLG